MVTFCFQNFYNLSPNETSAVSFKILDVRILKRSFNSKSCLVSPLKYLDLDMPDIFHGRRHSSRWCNLILSIYDGILLFQIQRILTITLFWKYDVYFANVPITKRGCFYCKLSFQVVGQGSGTQGIGQLTVYEWKDAPWISLMNPIKFNKRFLKALTSEHSGFALKSNFKPILAK